MLPALSSIAAGAFAGALFLVAPHGAYAQQFAGQVIANQLPNPIPGGALASFNVADAKGKGTTLMNYFSSPSGGTVQPSLIQRAIVVIHGLDRDPWLYFATVYNALPAATAINPAVNENTVAIMAPYFTNGDDKTFGYPWANSTGLTAGKGSTSNALVWSGSQWASGSVNQYPSKQTTVSSYAALDQVLQYFNNATLYPNLKHIVVAGHSLGGQMTQRYAMVGDQLNLRVPMSYWVGNPDSFGWMNSSRPYSTDSCPTYDNWRSGFSNYTNTYGASIVASGPAAVQSRWFSRRVILARGLADFGNDASDCSPYTQGGDRGARFFAFVSWFKPRTPQMVDYYPGVGHDAGTMFSQPAGVNRLFLDNWDGKGVYAPDYGPRQLAGGLDDPSPDPNYSAQWPNYTPTITLAPPTPTGLPPSVVSASSAIDAQVTSAPAFMSYAGCYTDSPAGSLNHLIWTGNSSTTIQGCVGACANAGYTVAGIEYGDQCYCGTQLANGATIQPDSACNVGCGGDTTQACGGSWLLSVYNSGALKIYNGPQTVNSTGPYNSIGCWTDQGGARTVSDKVPALGSSNTIEACAAACSGYGYFGVEYGAECYCGNTMNPASTRSSLSSCSMPCAANNDETCGAGNFLNMYQINGTLPTVVPTSTASVTGSSTSKSTATPSTTAGLTYVGCYTDPAAPRTLGFFSGAYPNMAPNSCSAMCTAAGYAYAGMEYADECYCGNSLPASSKAPDSDCSMACAGDSAVMCGASYRLSIWTAAAGGSSTITSAPSSVASSTASSVSGTSSTVSGSASATKSSSAPIATGTSTQGLAYAGCYQDPASPRTFAFFSGAYPNMAPNSCAAMCTTAGYTYAGMEYGDECYCGNTLPSSLKAPDSDCSMACAGDSAVMCGASYRLSIWTAAAGGSSTITSAASSAASSTATSVSSTSSVVSSSTSVTKSSSAPIATGTSTQGLAYAGCYQDPASPRTFAFFSGAYPNMAPNSCSAMCTAAGYTYAGMEYADECYCGNTLPSSLKVPDSDCSMACAGDSAVMCGASYRLSIWTAAAGASSSAVSSSVASTASSSAASSAAPSSSASSTIVSSTKSSAAPTATSTQGLSYAGCWFDSASRTLGYFAGGNAATMTPDSCSALCTAAGFSYAGIEYADECYCGNSLSLGSLMPDTDCNMPCAGDAAVMCGASWRLSVYTVGGTSSASASSVPASSTASSSAASSSAVSSSALSSSAASSSAPSSSVASSSAKSSSASSTVASSTKSSAAPTATSTQGLSYAGCWFDSASRTLGYFAGGNAATMTPDSCSALCTAAGFAYAGIEYADECYCGNSLAAGSLMPDTDCNMPCAGDAAVMCGAGWRLSVYTVGTASASATVASSTPSSSAVSSASSKPSSSAVSSASSSAISSASSPASSAPVSSSAPSSVASSSVHSSSTTPSATPSVPASNGYVGCYTDAASSRTLNTYYAIVAANTNVGCQATCSGLGYTYAGTEYGSECYCGNTLTAGSLQPASNCYMPCAGDASATCGGNWALSIYLANPPAQPKTSNPLTSMSQTPISTSFGPSTTSSVLPSTTVSSSSPASASAMSSAATSSTHTSATAFSASATSSAASATSSAATSSAHTSTVVSSAPVTSSTATSSVKSSTAVSSASSASPSASGVTYAGCYTDAVARTLSYFAASSTSMTPSTCSSTCASLGYPIAGIEYSTECYCGSVLDNGTVKQPDSTCSMACAGDASKMCGGPWLLSVYSAGIPKIAGPPTVVSTVGAYNSIGCWTDSVSARALGGKVPALGANNTVEGCAAACTGYNFFGVEYGEECYCANSLAAVSTNAAATDCSMACAGNPNEICGAGNRLNVYQHTAPAVARRGRFLFF